MIELQHDHLQFSFPDVHGSARLVIDFKRTLRIPDDDRVHRLPPGLGRFPLRHVDDAAGKAPASWLERGGVMLPMYQAEALWIRFEPGHDPRRGTYPFAIRVAAGKVNAVTGQQWTAGLHESPQDYVVAPEQPWLDGFCVSRGTIRQFVAMPLGQGYTAEEQITDAAEYGGLQIDVYPMKREVFERRFPVRARSASMGNFDEAVMLLPSMDAMPCASPDMGLAPGGRMKQTIHEDPFDFDDWDRTNTARCFVHIANSQVWQILTGEMPPTKPPTAADYTAAGLPWFDYYSEKPALGGSPILRGLKSVLQMGRKKNEMPLPENTPVMGEAVVPIGHRRVGNQVREGQF